MIAINIAKKRCKRRITMKGQLQSFYLIFFVSYATFQPTKADDKIMNNVNVNIDPCHDFYEFSCGNYVKHTVLQENAPGVTADTEINDQITNKLLTILKQSRADNLPFKFALLFFESCLTSQNHALSFSSTMYTILEQLGGWPVLRGSYWDEDKFDWKETLYKLRALGLPTDMLLPITVRPDDQNEENFKYVIHIDVPQLRGKTESELESYYKNAIHMLQLIGVDRAFAESELMYVEILEKNLADISKKQSKSATKLTIFQLQEKHKSIPWINYINNLLNITTKVNGDEVVNVANQDFIPKFVRLMRDTDNRTIANYMLLRAAEFLSKMLHKINELQSKKCLESVKSMDLAVSAMYARTYYDEETENIAVKIAENIQSAFLDMLYEDWNGDHNTKSVTINKIDDMKQMVLYPKQLWIDSALDNYYSTLRITNNTYFTFGLNLALFNTDKQYEKLGKDTRQASWTSFSYLKGIYYSHYENVLVIPQVMLQERIFSKNRLSTRNYGSLGVLIASTMLKAVDMYFDEGRQNMWSESTKEGFQKKIQCILSEYQNQTNTDTNVLEQDNILYDIIRNHNALKLAYLAYKKDMPLTSSRFGDQLFWISAANNWCAKYSAKETNRTIVNKFRLNFPLSNNKDFIRDFQCPVGSKMNPIRNCGNW